MWGMKISLGTAARGVSVKGGSAAAARLMERGRCGRAGLCSFSSFAHKAPRSFCNRQDDVEVSAVGGEGRTYGCGDDRWLGCEDSCFERVLAE